MSTSSFPNHYKKRFQVNAVTEKNLERGSLLVRLGIVSIKYPHVGQVEKVKTSMAYFALYSLYFMMNL